MKIADDFQTILANMIKYESAFFNDVDGQIIEWHMEDGYVECWGTWSKDTSQLDRRSNDGFGVHSQEHLNDLEGCYDHCKKFVDCEGCKMELEEEE